MKRGGGRMPTVSGREEVGMPPCKVYDPRLAVLSSVPTCLTACIRPFGCRCQSCLPSPQQCMAKLEKAQSECQGLTEKYTIVENDKKSLKQVGACRAVLEH